MGIDRKRMLEVADGVERVASRVDAVLARRDAEKSNGYVTHTKDGPRVAYEHHRGANELVKAGYKHAYSTPGSETGSSKTHVYRKGNSEIRVTARRPEWGSKFEGWSHHESKDGGWERRHQGSDLSSLKQHLSARRDDAGNVMADADNIASHKLALQHGYKNEEVNDLGNGDYAMLYTHPKGHSLATITSKRGGMKSFVHTPQSGDEVEGTTHAHLKKILAQHDDAR